MNKLLNPVKYFQDKKLLTVNLLIFCIGTFIAIAFSARFDGVLDLHFVAQRIPVKTMTDNIIDIIMLTLLLFIVGKIINNKTRMIDCLNTAFYSRIPMYLLCFTNVGGISTKLSETVLLGSMQTVDYTFLIILALLSITAVIITVLILFNGFKVATNAKKAKHYVYFFIGFIVAEIISAFILKNL
jgi:hypothetical protein